MDKKQIQKQIDETYEKLAKLQDQRREAEIAEDPLLSELIKALPDFEIMMDGGNNYRFQCDAIWCTARDTHTFQEAVTKLYKCLCFEVESKEALVNDYTQEAKAISELARKVSGLRAVAQFEGRK